VDLEPSRLVADTQLLNNDTTITARRNRMNIASNDIASWVVWFGAVLVSRYCVNLRNKDENYRLLACASCFT
jgi:hypothetical protein